MPSAPIDAYIAAQPPAFARALIELRARLIALLPGHIECLSYAMPGLRQPQSRGKMVIGYAAFTKHIGIYPHSGRIIAQIDCTPYKTSKSGLTYSLADPPPPDHLLRAIIAARLTEIAHPHAIAGGNHTPCPFT